MNKRQSIGRRQAYWRGQLLREDHFIDEQRFHLQARYQHNRNLHGFGVVHGLEVVRVGDHAVTVSPGCAIDRRGHEVELRQSETLEVQGLPAGATAWVSLGYRSERITSDDDRRIELYAQLRVATGVDDFDVRLATLQLDDKGRVAPGSVDARQRDLLRNPPVGSVTAESLAPELRRGWLTMAFHPTPLPDDEDGTRPPFRVGATRAMAHKELGGRQNPGAGGTMALVVPPGVRHVHRLRVAGEFNESSVRFELIKGGFDPSAKKHLRELLMAIEPMQGPYDETVDVNATWGSENRTLSLDVRSTGFVSVSLVGLDVSY